MFPEEFGKWCCWSFPVFLFPFHPLGNEPGSVPEPDLFSPIMFSSLSFLSVEKNMESKAQTSWNRQVQGPKPFLPSSVLPVLILRQKSSWMSFPLSQLLFPLFSAEFCWEKNSRMTQHLQHFLVDREGKRLFWDTKTTGIIVFASPDLKDRYIKKHIKKIRIESTHPK